MPLAAEAQVRQPVGPKNKKRSVFVYKLTIKILNLDERSAHFLHPELDIAVKLWYIFGSKG
ncbi:MAG: hypothetical protein WCQ41_06010 [Bacillota bacterium]